MVIMNQRWDCWGLFVGISSLGFKCFQWILELKFELPIKSSEVLQCCTFMCLGFTVVALFPPIWRPWSGRSTAKVSVLINPNQTDVPRFKEIYVLSLFCGNPFCTAFQPSENTEKIFEDELFFSLNWLLEHHWYTVEQSYRLVTTVSKK